MRYILYILIVSAVGCSGHKNPRQPSAIDTAKPVDPILKTDKAVASIVGAWLWRDSGTSFSLIIKEDGTISKHLGPINETITEKTLKYGTYEFKDDQKLMIHWDDKSSETDPVKLIGNQTLEIRLKDPKTYNLKTYTFVKVVDVEVELPPNKK